MWNDIEELIVLAFGPGAARIGAITLGSLIVLYIAIAVIRVLQKVSK